MEAIKEDLISRSIEVYDKGVNDCCDTIKGSFIEMKSMGFKSLTIDEVIKVIELSKEIYNKNP